MGRGKFPVARAGEIGYNSSIHEGAEDGMDKEKIRMLAKKYMRERKTHREREIGAVYFHGLRVEKGAVELRRMLTEDDSWDDRLRCAALFHDVGKGIGKHAHTGALLAADLLGDELTEEETRDVTALIEAHQDRKPGTDGHSFWQKILQDADLLDHYGAQGIWMCCCYYASHEEEMNQVPDFYDTEWPKQMKEHRALLNFDVSREIFDEKCRFEMEVARRMRLEGGGRYAISPKR